ncbi:2TM domain-containing protein [Tellurirhabdus rosea]|uniref:2TM domain-containing protein n=1 Tax=Tellurirhabdus rosea TaxID=2674997 RepID=UPI00225266D5|nr:2TM domain-containing protein [Tellurirhabdus rosea]
MENRDPHLWKMAKARAGFKMHLRTFLLVNLFLWTLWVVISLVTSGGNFNGFRYPWPLWATLGWGIGLASHYFSVYRSTDEQTLVEREYEKLRVKN